MEPSTSASVPSKHASDPLRKRSMQRVRSGMGQLFRSPQKARRNPTRKKRQTDAVRLKLRALERNLAELVEAVERKIEDSDMETTESRSSDDLSYEMDVTETRLPEEVSGDMDSEWEDTAGSFEDVLPDDTIQIPLPPKTRNLKPSEEKKQAYTRWLKLLPSLIAPYLRYLERTYQRAGPPSPHQETLSGCQDPQCVHPHKKNKVLCLYSHHFQEVDILWCTSSSLAATLVSHGLFPTAPAQPRQAVSLELLAFLKALFERSSEGAYAMAHALHTHYLRRGYRLDNKNGDTAVDPFRKGLTSAMQWYGCLLQKIEKKTQDILQHAASLVQDPGRSGPPPAECDRLLQARCPACFGGNEFGGSSDIIVSVDGTFNHRHVRSRGDCPPFYTPDYFISKEMVDEVGQKIEAVRKKPAKKRQKKGSQVPDEAIDICEGSHQAGSGSNVKTSMEHFDDGGIMGLVCRHDIPIFLANIDSPGEQQKYGVALILHLFSLIPNTATVEVHYDVGCVMDRSRQLYDIYPDDVSRRLTFGTSIMHSYAHEFACQIIYNPRYRDGIGLSDGEGTERLWSRLTGLIGITRMCGRQKRIFFLDRQLTAVGAEMRDDLGKTLHRRLQKNVPHHENTANAALARVTKTPEELMQMWDQQKQTQLSVRSHAPARIKKELDAILTLQTELEAVETSLQSTRTLVTSFHNASNISQQLLDTLEARQQDIGAQVEELYASLNVHESFPELKGIDLEFVRTLLMARDLKKNIRKRAIGSFSEYDKLNQAQGGGGPAIGTKMHQYIRQSIGKRIPAFRRSLRRYNELCARAASCYKREWGIPLPKPLPEDLTKLKSDPDLLEDVWIGSAPETTYEWLYDSDIREAMRAVHRKQRCLEEIRRIGKELDNLCRWFGRQVRSVEVALVVPENESFRVVLNHYRSQLLNLKSSWSSRSTAALFDTHLTSARVEAKRIHQQLGGVVTEGDLPLIWVKPMVLATVEETEESPQEDMFVTEDVDEAEDSGISETEESKTLEIRPGIDSGNVSDDAVVVLGYSRSLPDNTLDTTNLATSETPVVQRMDNPTVDPHLLVRIQKWIPSGRTLNNRDARMFTLMYADRSRRYTFEPEDIDRLAQARGWLNDECVNSLALLIQSKMVHSGEYPKASLCSIFSSFALCTPEEGPRRHNTQTAATLWAHAQHLHYWEHPVWIFPIHRAEGHWVSAVVQPRSSRMFLFDSFNNLRAWRSDVNDIIAVVTGLIGQANGHGHGLPSSPQPWDIRAVTPCVLQTTTYDCGLWVLAAIAAVLAGRHLPGLKEEDMVGFRSQLHHLVLSLPSKV